MSFELPIPLLDGIAILWFLLLVAGYRFVAERDPMRGRSITGAMLVHRRQWMLTMARRENRLMDAILLGNLSQGNAFFASTCAIAIGGLVTMLGYGDSARHFFEAMPMAAGTTPHLWEAKVVFMTSIFVYAFFKFAWAFRLTHYTAILIGATPLIEPGNRNLPEIEAYVARAAELNGIMADHAASGLRSFYYAIAALVWFYHPVLFMVATAWVVAILVRRDFFSHSRRAILGE
jgi:uncharacterized membrane protein